MTERLFILDAPGYVYRAYHALPYLSTSKGVPSHAVLGIVAPCSGSCCGRRSRTTSRSRGIRRARPSARRSSPRTRRRGRRRPDDLRVQIPYVRRLFEALRLPVLEVPGFEADDVLATLVDRRCAIADLDVVLVTGDKDMLQLVGPRVRVLPTLGRGGRARGATTRRRCGERWGVEPEQIPDVLALMGDSIDNIPGVPGVGEKTAVEAHRPVRQRRAPLREPARWCRASCARRWPPARKQALLSRELATVSTRVPLAGRPREPSGASGARLGQAARALDGDRVHAACSRQLPAAPAAAVAGEAGAGARRRRGARRLSGEGARGRRRSRSTGRARAARRSRALDGARPLSSGGGRRHAGLGAPRGRRARPLGRARR